MPELQTLLTRLEQLPQTERQILLAFAVVYEPYGQTSMKDLLTRLLWEDEQGKSLSKIIDKTWRVKMLKLELLVNEQNKLICHAALVEVLTRQAVKTGQYEAIRAAHRGLNNTYKSPFYQPNNLEKIQALRDALYQGDDTQVIELILNDSQNKSYSSAGLQGQLVQFCCTPFDDDWFASLTENIQYMVLSYLVQNGVFNKSSIWPDYLLKNSQQKNFTAVGFNHLTAELLLVRGELQAAHTLLLPAASWQDERLLSWYHFLVGDFAACVVHGDTALKMKRKLTRKRNESLSGLSGWFYILALYKTNSSDLEKTISLFQRNEINGVWEAGYPLLGSLMAQLNGGQNLMATHVPDHLVQAPELMLLLCLCWQWLEEKVPYELLASLAMATQYADQANFTWVAAESADLLRRYDFHDNEALQDIQTRLLDQDDIPWVPLFNFIQPVPKWQLALEALQSFGRGAESVVETTKKGNKARLAWWLESHYGQHSLTPKEQKLTAKGGWSKGRPVSLKRLHKEQESFDYLTAADKQICNQIRSNHNYGYYGGTDYYLDDEKALFAAIGHPYIYRESDPSTPIEIMHAEPQLKVEQNGQQLHIHLHPAMPEGSKLVVEEQGPHCLTLIRFNEQHQKIATILGDDGLTVPTEAKELVLQSISAVAPYLAIQSDIGGENQLLRQVEADHHLHIQIQPQSNGLRFACYVRPLGNSGPFLHPSEGGENLLGEVEGERVQTQRDKCAEQTIYKVLLKQCPTLQDSESEPYIWLLDEAMALEALSEIQQMPEPPTLSWPQGGRLQLSTPREIEQMKVSVRSEKDWFALDGEITLDEGKVLSLQKLLELLQSTPGRFVRLEDDQYLTLTQQLRQRLQAMQGLAQKQGIHPLAAGILDEVTDGMQRQGDEIWQAQTAKLQAAYALKPKLPTTLQAQLREYQLEGFQWLARLAHWGAGACLADDMGLGKTLQSLALILTRAAQGPTLILAPTSVCTNWVKEAARFAPTLNVHLFGTGDRQQLMDRLGPFDLLICSYGLLQTEVDKLGQVSWQTLVADEAQALKNINTRYEAMLGIRVEPPVPTATARSISESRGPFARSRLIDVGTGQGVRIGNPVINEHGLVGRVVGTSPRVSRVLLVTDVSSRIPVLIDRTDARAMLSGDGSGNPRLEYARGTDSVEVGDRVLTSGDGGGIPRGVPIGIVARGIDGSWRVKLFSDRGAIDFVKVMKFTDFGQLVDPEALNAPPLAALGTAPAPSATEAAAITDEVTRSRTVPAATAPGTGG